jgi:hypothetical protein
MHRLQYFGRVWLNKEKTRHTHSSTPPLQDGMRAVFDPVREGCRRKKPNAVAGFKSLSRTMPKGVAWSLRKQASKFYAEVFGLFGLIALAFVSRAS